ncbi:MAG: aminotransferase class I/II-fold pyridoxal phosphate-dependent enzyme [Cyanobacteria bacterium J06635_15]
MDQQLTPLLSQILASAKRDHAAFYTPGHKQGQGASAMLRSLVGSAALKADLPELPELDNLFAPEGVIAEAQDLAAAAFGAEQSWFLANGSTCGIEAAVLATCSPGDRILIPRNAHRSVISALVLSGAMPVYLQPVYDPDWDLVGGVDPAAIAMALETHPEIRAVLLVSPTYQGISSDLSAIADIVHAHGIPLLIDAAHGAHFGFHPALPQSALATGADLAVQSTHKTLGALTQAAMVHIQGARIDRDRLSQALQLTQSTSPNYLLLASLDAARQQMAIAGEKLMAQTIELAIATHQKLEQIPGIKVFSLPKDRQNPGFHTSDPTRLTIDVTRLGLSGFNADELLHNIYGVTAELPTLRQLTFIISLGNTPQDIEELVTGFTQLAQHHRHSPTPPLPHSPTPFPPSSLPPLSPRDAFFAPTETVSTAQATGRISSELICPYPPGIPLILPGEKITQEAIAALQHINQSGGIITGCTDTSLETWRVVKNLSPRPPHRL